MRIGMVTACYKPVINGVTQMISLYRQHLEAAGHEVTVFTLGEPDPAGDEPNIIRTPGIPLGDSGYYVNFRYTFAAQEELRRMDIIHCHHLFMSVEMASRYGQCPIVYTNHTRYDLYTGAYIPLPQTTADAIMRQIWPDFTDYCDLVITPTASVGEVMRHFGVTRPIEVIPNGVDLKPFHKPAKPLNKEALGVPAGSLLLVYVGRLADEKNLPTLLEQFALARDIQPELRLMLIGKGPQERELVEQAADLQLQEYVYFKGAMAYQEIPNILAAADAFITASTSEVHPLTVIEAMAAGLPVIGVMSPGISDTVEPGRTGILASKPEGLAAATIALTMNDDKRRSMGEQARQSSHRYDIQVTVAQTVALYERLRRTRPDLIRQEERRLWNRLRNQPMLEQLGRLLRPPAD